VQLRTQHNLSKIAALVVSGWIAGAWGARAEVNITLNDSSEIITALDLTSFHGAALPVAYFPVPWEGTANIQTRDVFVSDAVTGSGQDFILLAPESNLRYIPEPATILSAALLLLPMLASILRVIRNKPTAS
jgi:hypothetical protein